MERPNPRDYGITGWLSNQPPCPAEKAMRARFRRDMAEYLANRTTEDIIRENERAAMDAALRRIAERRRLAGRKVVTVKHPSWAAEAETAAMETGNVERR